MPTMRHSAALERRLAAAEQKTRALFERRVAELVGAEFGDAPAPVQRAMLAQMRAWHRQQVSDPTRPHDVGAFLRAVAEAAPEIANRVAGKLGVDVSDSS
jgi:hypothetical protein